MAEAGSKSGTGRTATISRDTNETKITGSVALDGTGAYTV